MKKRFTLMLASMFLTIGAWAQIEFTFTRNTWPNADVTVNGATGVTANIAATAASGGWNEGGALGSATNILCANTNTSATSSASPITYTLTISGLDGTDYNSVTFTHKAMNSGGNYQPSGSDIRHCNLTLTANGTEFSVKTDENIWVANGSQNYSKDIEFTSTNNELTKLTANEDGTLTLVLTIYKGTTNAGCFYGLTKVTLNNYTLQLADLITEAQTLHDAIKDNKDVIGYYTTASVDALDEAITTAEGVVTATESDVNALQAAIDGLQVVLPTLGKFYRFKHPTLDAYMLSDEYSDTRLAMGALESNKVSSIFYYGEDGTLLSYAIGCYLPAAVRNGDWTCLAVGSEAPVATFGAGSAIGTVGFYLGTDASRAYYSARKTYVDAGGNFGSDAGYDWVVEEVVSLPVTIGTAGYATLHAPVALTVHTDVKAYTGTLNGEWLTLNEISTTIPANTAVILEATETLAEATTFNFAVAADVETVDNDLVGTVEAEVTSGTVYTLQSHEGGVAFKKYNGTNLKGFRAYLTLPETTETLAIRITRGGDEDTTGIEQLAGDNAEVVIYDLAGRRVEKMEKGIYIVNGKKVVIR